MKLTQGIIDNAVFDPQEPTLWDDQVPGFGVRLFKTGKKSYIVRYRIGSRKRYRTLAGTHLINLRDARKEARKLLYQVSIGEDPDTQKRKPETQPTFKDLTDRYRSDHLAYKKRKASWENRIDNSFPKIWAHRPAVEITRQDIKNLHQELSKRGKYTANRTVDLIRAMYNFGRDAEIIPEDHPNPAKRIKRHPEPTRDRYVTEAEARRLLQALVEDRDIYTRVYFTVLLLTGLRGGELLTAKWEDIERDTDRLRLPDTKAGKTQWIPLAKDALAQIDSLPKTSSPYLFPGIYNPEEPRSTFRKPWKRICKAANLTPGRAGVTVHDLRRSFGSWLSQSGVDLNTVRQLLRHANINTTLIYARLGADAGRTDVEALSSRLTTLVDINPKPLTRSEAD